MGIAWSAKEEWRGGGGIEMREGGKVRRGGRLLFVSSGRGGEVDGERILATLLFIYLFVRNRRVPGSF